MSNEIPSFTFIPTYYRGRKGYRPAVRVMRANKMVGSKAAPFLFDSAELALAHAKTAAAFVCAGERNVWSARVADVAKKLELIPLSA